MYNRLGNNKKKNSVKTAISIVTLITLIIGIPITVKQLFFSEEKKEPSNSSASGNGINIPGNGNTVIINPPGIPPAIEQISPKEKNKVVKKHIFPETNEDKIVKQKIKIAILPFEYVSEENKYSWLSRGIPESLLESLSQLDIYILIEGNLRDKVLKEIDFQQGKYIDEASAVKIGKLLGSQQIIIGSYQINEGKIKITSRIVDVESGKVESKSIVEHIGSIEDPFQVEKDYALKVSSTLNKKLQ